MLRTGFSYLILESIIHFIDAERRIQWVIDDHLNVIALRQVRYSAAAKMNFKQE